jgi:hypothetical protein
MPGSIVWRIRSAPTWKLVHEHGCFASMKSFRDTVWSDGSTDGRSVLIQGSFVLKGTLMMTA